MKRFHLPFVILVVILAIFLAACGVPSADETATSTVEDALAMTEQAMPPERTPTSAPPGADCPLATDETYVLRNPRHGYCLLYPTTHKVERPNPDQISLVVGGLLNVTDPRADIAVLTGGQTAEAFADEMVAGFEGFDIPRSETTVADQPAVVLDQVPGQDFSRRVIFTYEGRLYYLSFSPVNPDAPEVLDAFVQGVLDSFTFIPVSDTVTAEDECVQPKADAQQVLSERFGFCVLIPADFIYEEPSEANANVFLGSMMDVEHPKLMLEVTNAGGLTAAQAADQLVTSFPDMEIERTFGDALGYEPADRLDGVPGQDLGRVLLAVHNDRLYRLTFVPDDAAQGDVYAQMEALFAQVLQTWRFLP